MSGDPLQPVLGGDVPFDGTAFEVESRAEFDTHLVKKSFAGLIVLGLRLDRDPPDFTGVDVRGDPLRRVPAGRPRRSRST